tara:strand:+ start:1032 stop:1517 length:486 start_codon:yes stop_codon:yes gene_type:complete
MSSFALTTTVEELMEEKAELRETIKDQRENSRDQKETIRDLKGIMKEQEVFEQVAYNVINLTGPQVKCLYEVINTEGRILLASGTYQHLKTGLLTNATVVNAHWAKFVARYGEILADKALTVPPKKRKRANAAQEEDSEIRRAQIDSADPLPVGAGEWQGE